MHPALWKLLRLYSKASWRRLLRGARTIRGALMLLIALAGLVVTLGSTVVSSILMRNELSKLDVLRREMPWNPMLQPGLIAPYLPLLVLGAFLKAVLGKSGWRHLYFTPAEIDFLFAGPFPRRELLLFRLVRTGLSTLIFSMVLVSTPLGLAFKSWWAAFVGLTLTMVFVSLAGLAATLSRMLVAEAAHTRARRALLFAVGALAAVALPRTVSGARVLHHANLIASFRSTWPGRILLSPFEVFSNAMLAERWFPDLVGWATAAFLIDVGLLWLVLKLDADYFEWSAAISEWVYEMQQTARRGGGMIARAAPRGRFRLPVLPWLGGAGPILWRQLLTSHRKLRGGVRMAVVFNIIILAWNWFASGSYPTMTVTPAWVLVIFGYGTFMGGGALPLAFRGDVHHLDVLKSMPVRPIAIAAGELLGCAAVLSSSQVAFVAIYGLATLSGGWMLPAAAILGPAVNYLFLAVGNALFLIYPVPTTPGASADLGVIGRVLWTMLLQMLMMVPLLGFPAAVAGLAYLASGYSWPAMIAAALATLAVEAIPMTMLAAWAFDRFDPSRDTPA